MTMPTFLAGIMVGILIGLALGYWMDSFDKMGR